MRSAFTPARLDQIHERKQRVFSTRPVHNIRRELYERSYLKANICSPNSSQNRENAWSGIEEYV